MAVKFKKQCSYCGKQFTLPSKANPIPRHALTGERIPPPLPSNPCPGSGGAGNPLGPVSSP